MGFEFVNGFHDTANAVATVIYTHSLEPHIAVVWSGLWNFLGVVTSSGLVAFGIISLLPVELILQVGSKAGFAMVFALLVAAIIWNLSTWYFGLPASSSHTLIGSIIGVGIANQLMSVRTGTSGVDWGQALNIGKSLLLSPLVGFAAAFLLLSLMKAVVKNKKLYEAPEGTQPPPFWIRALLLLTCTGVSFAHGSNDGQKGMGLIMLILIGTDLPFGFNYSFEAMNYAKNAGNLLLVRPRVIGSKSSGLLETKEPRNFSIEFEGPARTRTHLKSRCPQATRWTTCLHRSTWTIALPAITRRLPWQGMQFVIAAPSRSKS